MKPINTHGAIRWAELQTSDPEAATAFYSALFEWETQTMEIDFAHTPSATLEGNLWLA